MVITSVCGTDNTGSIPVGHPFGDFLSKNTRRGGETGIHEGLKIPWQQCRAGSIPARGTTSRSNNGLFFYVY